MRSKNYKAHGCIGLFIKQSRLDKLSDKGNPLKILILQRYFGLSDEQVEYQIIDRASFREFLMLSSGDNVPDEKTVW